MTKPLVTFMLLLGWATAPFSAENPAPVLLVLGDSLSAAYGIDLKDGWVALLEDRLREQGYPYRVTNASISGETTSGGRRRLPALLASHQPRLVLIELGANDGLRGVSLSEIDKNFVSMLQDIANSDATAIVVRMQLPPNYGPAYTQGFNSIYDKLAHAAPGLTLAPFFLSEVILEPELMQPDGLHPTAAAQPRMLDAVWPSLQRHLLQTPSRQP